MKSKKTSPRNHSLWKSELGCSEKRISEIAGELLSALGANDWVFLEGELGAGKSTFARFVIEQRDSSVSFAGSPTFALAHEYPGFVHLDLYRMESEAELEQAGVYDYFWQSGKIVLCEWASKFKGFMQAATQRPIGKIWWVGLDFSKAESQRDVRIEVQD